MSDSQEVVIAGAGGFGREVLRYAQDACESGWNHSVVGFIDDSMPVGREVVPGFAVVGSTEGELHGFGVIIAVGEPEQRKAIAERVTARGGHLVTLVHPSAYVAEGARLGEGSVVCPLAMVGVGARLGNNVALNVYASAGHDSAVGDHSVLSPYSCLLGFAQLGSAGFLGSQACIAPGVSLGPGSKLAVGAYAKRDAAAGSLLVGNPARGRVMYGGESTS